MTYRLYRVTGPCADVGDGGLLLGDYPSFDAALDARDDDTTALFAATQPGATLLACHQIVGPDHDGPVECPITTHLPRLAGSPDEITDTRAWLRRIHTPASTEELPSGGS